MDYMLWKFPLIGNQIFKKLSNKSLAKCKDVGRTWEHFITNEMFYKQRVKYETLQKERDPLAYGETPLHKAAAKGKNF